ncbi:MAG: hypothetical protein OXC92_02145 [Flavobacteriaceae bacterium]|nr:hypothetical protein [Flavobacteriaceae bacterium]MCY4215769.1 hypothetical protein [Flavobacteriaceae bacterium]MCY4253997.1 hypothetical protein [Flavobacteriaceae bacterium]
MKGFTVLEKEIAGQKHLLERLKSTIRSNKQPHAQLFVDENGYGGLPIALYCSVLLLYSPEQLIKKIEQGHHTFHKLLEHPDFYALFPLVQSKSHNTKAFFQQWLNLVSSNPYVSYHQWISQASPGSKQSTITVKEIQSLQSSLELTSFYGGNRVCLIWGLDKMNATASNKFLKLLEEPPSSTYFLLVSESKSSLLPTILSRCQFIDLRPVNRNDLLSYSKNQDINIPESFELKATRGSVRELMDRLNASADSESIETLFSDLLRRCVKFHTNRKFWNEVSQTIDKIVELTREQQNGILSFGKDLIRQAFLRNCEIHPLVYYQSRVIDLERLAPYVHDKNYIELIHHFDEHATFLMRNANTKMVFTNLALKISELISR